MTQRDHQVASRRVRRALASLMDDQPFFGAMVLQMPIIPGGTETLAADGKNIRFNPEWVSKSELPRIKSAVARVTLACSLKHHLRRNERDRAVWQMASVAVTEPILREAGLHSFGPDIPGVPDNADDLTAEKAYDLILRALPPQARPQPGQGHAQGSRQNAHTGAPGRGEIDPNGNGEVQDWPGEGGGEDKADGEADGGEPGAPAEAQRPGADAKAARDAEAERWDEIASQAMVYHRAERPGQDPGRLGRKIAAKHVHLHDWRGELARFATDRARTDYSWSRPNRRFVQHGIYLPDLHGQSMGPIVLAVDTSGSVDEELLAQFWAELRTIAEDLNPASVRVIQCDAEVTSDERFEPTDMPARIEVRGGGGTDFAPVFKRLADRPGMDGKPECLIYFSDMLCDSHGEQPDFPVLWAQVGEQSSGYYKPKSPSFGEVLVIQQ